MARYIVILAVAALVVALPFIFRREAPLERWAPGDPELVIVSPHNEAIRHEFGRAFSDWHETHFGAPVKVDWRAIGGTTEIMRYLAAEYIAAFRAWWTARNRDWPAAGEGMILDRRFDPDRPIDDSADPAARAAWQQQVEVYTAFRAQDNPSAFTCKIDLFFGGGVYDHGKAAAQGLTVPPWSDPPDGLFELDDGTVLIPERRGGEIWRTDHFFGNALSTFGICYNRDRLADLGIDLNPSRWEDLAAPEYFGELGVADPTKSGSIAKAFEMIVHEQCRRAVRAAGFSAEDTARFEADTDAMPAAYQQAVETGWENGLRLIQRIGANARYFTDAAGQVPVDVSMGNAAAGIAIDFYGRFQAENSRVLGGAPRMVYVTPAGGSSVSADPISLLRGAPHRAVAVRFIEFVLSPAGQRLWNYAPEAPGPPYRYALRRLPVRRDFYPSDHPRLREAYERHRRYTTDPLGDPDVNPYVLSEHFVYYPRWTARHFGFHRDFIRAMCMNAADELRAAWRAIIENGGPEAQPEAVRRMERFPEKPAPVTWSSAVRYSREYERMDYMREWTIAFRRNYREARSLVRPPAAEAAPP